MEADDRFDRLEDGTIDVLCDPVTLRYSDEKRVKAGIFSPMVFATGITYLQRRDREGRSSIYIGYARGSTAERAAQRACEVDLFGVVPADQKAELAVMCETAWAARRIADAAEQVGYVVDGIVNGSAALTRFVSWLNGLFDLYIIDGIVNAIANLTFWVGNKFRRIQTGNINSYLYGILIAIALAVIVKIRYWS